MIVHVLALGRAPGDLTLPEGATVADLLAQVGNQSPKTKVCLKGKVRGKETFQELTSESVLADDATVFLARATGSDDTEEYTKDAARAALGLDPKSSVSIQNLTVNNFIPAAEAMSDRGDVAQEARSGKHLVARWEDLTLYPMDAKKLLRYRVGEAGMIRTVHCDTLRLTKGEFHFLYVIVNGLPLGEIKNYGGNSRATILSELRSKLCAYFGPTADPLGRGGMSPKFRMKPEAGVYGGQEREPSFDDDD